MNSSPMSTLRDPASPTEKLAALREMLRAAEGEASSRKEIFPFSFGGDAWGVEFLSLRNPSFRNGIPQGALTAIVSPAGGGKSELVFQFLGENPRLRVAWIEEELTLYPCALERFDVGLERVLLIEAAQEGLWCAHQVLRSQLFEVVVLMLRQLEEMDLRRLQLAAEKSGAALILLRETPIVRGAWAIHLRLRVRRMALLGSADDDARGGVSHVT